MKLYWWDIKEVKHWALQRWNWN